MAKTKFVTQSKLMRELLKEVEFIRNSDCPVLIIGETGTGKEILSDYIYANSPRCGNRFVKVSLSSLPSSLFESELFGHERGAYTEQINLREDSLKPHTKLQFFLTILTTSPCVCSQSY